MTGNLVIWLGSLVLALAMDAAVNARLAVYTVRRHQRRTVVELTARSAAEYGAMLLQRDADRAVDGPGYAWATAVLPDSGEYRNVWPRHALFVITDLEREAAAVSPSGPVPPGAGVTPADRPRWINALTAPAETWEAVGFTVSGALALVQRAAEGISDPNDLSSASGLTGSDLQLLRLLLDRGLLSVRSEFFRVAYSEASRWGAASSTGRGKTGAAPALTGAGYAMVLRREPARGSVRLLSMERITHGP